MDRFRKLNTIGNKDDLMGPLNFQSTRGNAIFVPGNAVNRTVH